MTKDKRRMTNAMNNTEEEKYNIRRPILAECRLESTHHKITEDHLNPVELDMLKMVKFHLERLADIRLQPDTFGYSTHRWHLNSRGIPITTERLSSYWDYGVGGYFIDSFNLSPSKGGKISTHWMDSIHQFKELGDGLNNDDVVWQYLIEVTNDWREERVTSIRYRIDTSVSLNENIFRYIKHYYEPRFKGPIKQWGATFDIDFSPK